MAMPDMAKSRKGKRTLERFCLSWKDLLWGCGCGGVLVWIFLIII